MILHPKHKRMASLICFGAAKDHLLLCMLSTRRVSLCYERYHFVTRGITLLRDFMCASPSARYDIIWQSDTYWHLLTPTDQQSDRLLSLCYMITLSLYVYYCQYARGSWPVWFARMAVEMLHHFVTWLHYHCMYTIANIWYNLAIWHLLTPTDILAFLACASPSARGTSSSSFMTSELTRSALDQHPSSVCWVPM